MPEPPRPGTRPEPPCVHPDAGAYALGLLEPDERARYQRHLRDCPRCSRAVRSLAPLIELLAQVDADSLLAATDPPPPRHPPHPVRVLSPARPPGGRLLFPARPPGGRPLPAGRTVRRRTVNPGTARTATPLRRLVLAAAVVTVVSLVGFVTFSARSSVDAPRTTAHQEPASIVDSSASERAAPTPPPASPSRSSDPTRAPANRTATRATEPPPDPTTPPPTTAGDQPNTLDAGAADSGALPSPRQYEARDPRTGATATVEMAAGAVTVSLSKVSGTREGTITVTTTRGETARIAAWRISTGDDSVVARIDAPELPDDIARVDIRDDDGDILVSVPTL